MLPGAVNPTLPTVTTLQQTDTQLDAFCAHSAYCCGNFLLQPPTLARTTHAVQEHIFTLSH